MELYLKMSVTKYKIVYPQTMVLYMYLRMSVRMLHLLVVTVIDRLFRICQNLVLVYFYGIVMG